MRRMRLRDQLELTKEMTNDTVIYLSPDNPDAAFLVGPHSLESLDV